MGLKDKASSLIEDEDKSIKKSKKKVAVDNNHGTKEDSNIETPDTGKEDLSLTSDKDIIEKLNDVDIDNIKIDLSSLDKLKESLDDQKNQLLDIDKKIKEK
ncbi:MAG: hypothetical protein ACP5MW_04030, partial [Thermoplasmata archaeon]